MRILALGLFIASVVFAQPERKNLLLPHPVRISGIVVDASGKPIPDAVVAHTNSQREALRTDAAGRFATDTNAPWVVVEKPGFNSQRVKTIDARDIRVTLDRLSRSFPSCGELTSYVGLDGGMPTAFYFPKVIGIKATRPVSDTDYVARRYSTSVSGKKYWVSHGTGGMWGLGQPFDEWVWKSTEYEQAQFEIGGVVIFDARGVLPNGNRWHHLGTFGVSASYEDVPPEPAAVLDKLLDGACLHQSPQS